MKKLKPLYRILTEDEKCLCPVCHEDRLAFITDRGIKLSYKALRAANNKINNLADQITFKHVECLNCHSKYLIDWMATPIAYAYVERKKNENTKHKTN